MLTHRRLYEPSLKQQRQMRVAAFAAATDGPSSRKKAGEGCCWTAFSERSHVGLLLFWSLTHSSTVAMYIVQYLKPISLFLLLRLVIKWCNIIIQKCTVAHFLRNNTLKCIKLLIFSAIIWILSPLAGVIVLKQQLIITRSLKCWQIGPIYQFLRTPNQLKVAQDFAKGCVQNT